MIKKLSEEDVTRPLFDFSELSEGLLDWYDRKRRILPWREDPQPYRVWLSEIMLQQTRVEAALDYFERFLKELPDIPALAAAPEEQLLKLWQGLGYYNRVMNLQKAARVCVEKYGGALPGDYEALKSLPGIGEYTAGAIGSIAFGLPVTAVDGNVLRVMTRLSADGGDITKPSVKARITELTQSLQPAGRPGDFNQAVMDLGATVCLPNGLPRCGQCPLSKMCEAKKQERMLDFPVKPEKRPRTKEEITAMILIKDGKTALRKREKTGILKNLWEFPNAQGKLNVEEAAGLCNQWGLQYGTPEKCGAYKHVFTHIEWKVTVYFVAVEGKGPAEFVWADSLEEYAVPSAFRPCCDWAAERL